MPARTGKCINFGGCNKADSREVITVPEGNDFVCPDCEKGLVASGGSQKNSGGGGRLGGAKLKLIAAAVVGLGIIGTLVAWLVNGSSPSIQDFAVEPVRISAGQTANLKWTVEHASEVSIDRGIGAVQTEDTLPVSPQGTTTYTLTAKSGNHSSTKTVTLQVTGQAPAPVPSPVPAPVPSPVPSPGPTPVPAPLPRPLPQLRPVIDQLIFTPNTVHPGQTTILHWSTRNATSVSLPTANPPKTNLPPMGSMAFTPNSPGVVSMQLMATGSTGSVQRLATLRVVNGSNPIPGPGPGSLPRPQPEPGPQQEEREASPAPASGTLVWEGDVQGVQLVTIQNGVATPGQLVSGRLPGVAVILQQENEKKVGIASPPSPDNNYQRLVIRVFGHGHTRVVISWSTP